MPVTICAAIRVGSYVTPERCENVQSLHAYAETRKKSAEPTETSRWVRSPASRSRISRSSPIAPPSAAASEEAERHVERAELRQTQRSCASAICAMPADARSISSSSQLARERLALGRRLHLDEPAVARHHDVHVDVGRRVLGVLEVEPRLAVDDADRDCCDRVRRARARARSGRARCRAATYAPEIAAHRVPPSAWRTSQSSQTVRSPSFSKSTSAAKGASDQALDLDRPPALLARARPRAARARPSTRGGASTRPSSTLGRCP